GGASISRLRLTNGGSDITENKTKTKTPGEAGAVVFAHHCNSVPRKNKHPLKMDWELKASLKYSSQKCLTLADFLRPFLQQDQNEDSRRISKDKKRPIIERTKDVRTA
ncbi:unnamed protein product, partial [Gulo gulo]